MDGNSIVAQYQKDGIVNYRGHEYTLYTGEFGYLDDTIQQVYGWMELEKNVAVGLTVVVIVAVGVF